jgi:hypothetical protein
MEMDIAPWQSDEKMMAMIIQQNTKIKTQPRQSTE